MALGLEDKIRGGFYGLLVGDALGVPYEFQYGLEKLALVEMNPIGRHKSWNVPAGTWSDDGALTLALADSLATVGHLDEDDFGRRIQAWFTKGHYTPDGKAFDVGNTTQEAILRMMRGHAAKVAGLTGERSNGNGSLMRTLPLALFHQGSDADLYADAGRASAVTHGHDVSKAACGVYCVAARHMLSGRTASRAFIEGLKLAHVKLEIPPRPGGSGFVLDSLAYAIHGARSEGSYEDVVSNAVRLGGDTDTTAAIIGGLLGLRDGVGAIPERWLSVLRGRELADQVIESFIKARNPV